MREHIETLVTQLSGAIRRMPHATRRTEPRRRRPRVARSTYRPVRRDLASPTRFAH